MDHPDARRFLVRHALVQPSARLVLYGSLDVALRAAALLHRWLAARLPRPARWVAAPLARTGATAAAIFAAGYPAAPLEVEGDLAEQLLGEWQGIPHEALTERLRHPPPRFWPHGAEERPPGGESLSDVRARVGPVLERLAKRGGDTFVAAHGGLIRAALARALDLSPHRALAFSIQPGMCAGLS